jgi:hypothetical protein
MYGSVFRIDLAPIADHAISPTVFEVRMLDTPAFQIRHARTIVRMYQSRRHCFDNIQIGTV